MFLEGMMDSIIIIIYLYSGWSRSESCMCHWLYEMRGFLNLISPLRKISGWYVKLMKEKFLPSHSHSVIESQYVEAIQHSVQHFGFRRLEMRLYH